MLVRRTRAAGATLEECAKVIKLGTGMLSRFVSVQKLPPDLLHLVDWGRRRGSIGFTAAVELVRVPDEDDQRAIARVILEEGLQTGEVRQVAQILRRSRRPVEECIAEILGCVRQLNGATYSLAPWKRGDAGRAEWPHAGGKKIEC